MKQIVYTGTADVQVFGADDFKKAGLEQKKLTFAKGEAVEVEDAVAEVLIDDSPDNIFGSHMFDKATEKNSINFKKDPVEASEEPEPEVDPKKTSKGAGKAGATSSGGNISTAGSGSST